MPEPIKLVIADSPECPANLGFVKCVKDEQTGEILGLFRTYEDASSFRYDKVATPEDKVNYANRILRANYYQDVRDTASSIQDELTSRVKDGEYGEELREWLIEHIDETIDGSSRIIYTASAIECMHFSDNDGAYFDDFGSDGAVEDGSINWSRLAYSAFKRDVEEQLEALGVDLNNPVPNCDKCDSSEQDQSRKAVDGHDGLLCEDCVEEIENEADETGSDEDEPTEDETEPE